MLIKQYTFSVYYRFEICSFGLELIMSTLLLTVIFNIFAIWRLKKMLCQILLEGKILSACEYIKIVKIDHLFTLMYSY